MNVTNVNNIVIPKAHSTEELQAERKRLITAVAKVALKELAISLIFASITIVFMTSPASLGMLLFGIFLISIINTTLRAVSGIAQYDAFNVQHLPLDDPKRIKVESFAESMKKVTNYFCPMSFSLIDNDTRNLMTHEAGHALAALILYKHPDPSISVDLGFPTFSSGLTSYKYSELTSAGEAVGKNNVDAVIGASGAGLALSFSIFNIILAHKLRKSHPTISRYLNAMAITSIATHAVYAFSALWAAKDSLSHDFVRLWASGVHPLLSFITMIAIPLIVKGVMMLYDHYKNKQVANTLPTNEPVADTLPKTAVADAFPANAIAATF